MRFRCDVIFNTGSNKKQTFKNPSLHGAVGTRQKTCNKWPLCQVTKLSAKSA